MSTTQANAAKSYDELKKLRADILTAQKERDDHFNKVVKLTDQVNQLENEKEQLRKRSVDMANDVARADQLLRKLGYDKNRDYSEIPPTVDGTILATPGAGLVEISIGADQGLIEKHQLEVYRVSGGQSTYVGRIEVVKTSPDRAVCKIDPKFQQSNMMVGDRVATKIK
jgi:chromosome segregation ATPase